jgi:small-conductance mechanosensitive channel
MNGQAKVLAQIALWKVLLVALLVAGTWGLLKWMRGFFDRLEKHNLRLRFVLRQIEPPLRIVAWFAALLISAEILAPSKEAFFAALGSAALAIGLGLQDLIKNLIGGLVVVADRPYQTGDRIKVGDAYGEVVQIGLRSTKIQTANDVLVTIPNSEVLTSLIFNANAGVADCLVTTEMVLPHNVDAEFAMRIGREIAVSCPYTHLERPIDVELIERNTREHPLVLYINAYVYDHRFEDTMRTDILRRAKHQLAEAPYFKQEGPNEVRENVIDFVQPRTEQQSPSQRGRPVDQPRSAK